MAGILNRTARQFNLKTVTPEGQRAVVRIAPGFNVVPDEVWAHFVSKDRMDPYVSGLQKDGQLEFGPHVDDMELERDPDTAVKYKVESIANLHQKMQEANKEAEKATLENLKLKADLDKALADAEKAKIELEKAKSEKPARSVKKEG